MLGRTLAAIAALLTAVLAVLTLAMSASGADTGETIATPSDDAQVRSDVPGGNYAADRLAVENKATLIRRSFLRFNVTVPAGATVTGAKLRVFTQTAASPEGVSVRRAPGGWTENTVTWANAPALGTLIANRNTFAASTWVEWDVSSAVAEAGGEVNLALATTGTKFIGFESSETRTGNVPQLVVTHATPPPPPAGALHSTPSDAFVKADGTSVALHGFNVTPVWTDVPGGTWGQERYDQIAARGFNAVRFVLKWSDFEPSQGQFDSVDLATLDTAVARAKAAGLWVVLDCIHLFGTDGMSYVPAWAKTGDSVTTIQTNAGGYLKMLAGRYREEPNVAAYDLVNEPYRWPVDQNGVLRMYDSIIRQVRTVDPHKIAVIEPTFGDTSIAGSLADFSKLTDKANVVWSIHDYFAGGDDDGYNADGSKAGTYVYGGTKGYPSSQPAQLEAHLRVHVDKLASVGIPMWIGEYGIGDGVTNHDQWIRDKVALFDRYGLGRAWWEYYTTGPMSATDASHNWKPWVDLIARPEVTASPA